MFTCTRWCAMLTVVKCQNLWAMSSIHWMSSTVLASKTCSSSWKTATWIPKKLPRHSRDRRRTIRPEFRNAEQTPYVSPCASTQPRDVISTWMSNVSRDIDSSATKCGTLRASPWTTWKMLLFSLWMRQVFPPKQIPNYDLLDNQIYYNEINGRNYIDKSKISSFIWFNLDCNALWSRTLNLITPGILYDDNQYLVHRSCFVGTWLNVVAYCGCPGDLLCSWVYNVWETRRLL